MLSILILALGVEFVTVYMFYNHMNTNWIYLFYAPVECWVYGNVFAQWAQKRAVKMIIYAAMIAFIIFHILVSVFYQDINEMNSTSLTLLCVYYAAISAYSLFRVTSRDYGSIRRNYQFWFGAALLFYSGGEIIFFAFTNILGIQPLWQVHLIINSITYLIFAYGFYVCGQYGYPSEESVTPQNPQGPGNITEPTIS